MENKKENKILKAKVYCETVSFDESGDYSIEYEFIEEIKADDFENLLSSIQGAYVSWCEWSSSDPRIGDWLVSESQMDMYSGVYESYTCHFEEKLTHEQINCITKALKIKNH